MGECIKFVKIHGFLRNLNAWVILGDLIEIFIFVRSFCNTEKLCNVVLVFKSLQRLIFFISGLLISYRLTVVRRSGR